MNLEEQAQLYARAKKLIRPCINDPGMVDIDLGMEMIGGELTGDLSIRFKVTEKKALSFLKKSQRLPSSLGEFKTDVLEVVPEPHTFRDPSILIRPLIGGPQILSSQFLRKSAGFRER